MGNTRIVYLLFLLRFVSALRNPLLDSLYQYCPTSLDCESDKTAFNPNRSQQACCGTCGCDMNCGKTQSCCLQEENEVYKKATGLECIEPVIGDTNMLYASSGYAVMMVTQCIDEHIDCKYKDGSIIISPVSTPSCETFLNEECAICNNVGKFIHWAADVKIRSYDFLLNVWQSPETSEMATRIFRPPKGTTPTSCIATQIDEAQMLCSNDLYIHLCKSLNLPFTFDSYTYRNIFCFFCEYNSDTRACGMPIPKQDVSMITMLVDSSISLAVRSSYFGRKNDKGDACPPNYMPHPTQVNLQT